MYGASNRDKAITLLNQLEEVSTDLIIPHMDTNDWSYEGAKAALLKEFGSVARLTEQKNAFLLTTFKKDEIIKQFVDRFYLEAQILTGSGTLTVHNAQIAICSAVKPYKALYRSMLLVFQDNIPIETMVHFLKNCGDSFGPPNTSRRLKPQTSPMPHKDQVRPMPQNQSPDLSKITCNRCNRKGHYTSSCNSKTAIHALPPIAQVSKGKEQVE